MNILYIVQSNPLNISYGSAQRTNHLWNALKQCGNVYTALIVSPNDNLINDENNNIRSFVLVPKTCIGMHLWSYFARLVSPAIWPFQSISYVKKQLPWKNIHFDYVVVRYLRHVIFSQAWKIGPCYVDIDDLPSESFETITKIHYSKFLGILLSKYVKIWQSRILKNCKGAWIANPQQVPYVKKYCNCMHLSNIAISPSNEYNVTGNQKKQLMTIGLMSYPPNYEGINWFLENVWIDLHKKYPELNYMIAGRGLPQQYNNIWKKYPNVFILGYVEKLEKLYEESLAVVTPILSGSGTCIKVQEACLYGRKVFSTKFAVRGLDRNALSELEIDIFSNKDDFLSMFSDWYDKKSMDNTYTNNISNKAIKYINNNEFENSVKYFFSLDSKNNDSNK